jgi:bilirubin oxidase
VLSRRHFLKAAAGAGAGVLVPLGCRSTRVGDVVPGGSLDPAAIPKYAMPLSVPAPMPRTGTLESPDAGAIDHYEIAARQFRQRILPPGLPETTVWGYGSPRHPGSFGAPALTIEARFRRPVRVTWINDLRDARGGFLPHLLPVDPTLHWANPAGGAGHRDMRPAPGARPGPYTGPVPIVTHLHGGHTADDSDGYPEAWYLPAARNIPAGFAREGTWYERFGAQFQAKWGVSWPAGAATFQYDNDQGAATLWYHDHALGVTRLGVYAGLAGLYVLRGGPNDLPPDVLPGPDPPGRHREIPLVIQDRSFEADGSLFYPASRAFFDGYAGPYWPDTDIAPVWNPEFFGNTVVVNGRTWPFLEVEQRRYRFRVLNACGSRFLILKVAAGPLARRPAAAALPIWQIGADGGFLPRPAPLDGLLLAPAERADVIVDFTRVPAGTELYVINEGPDEPFRGGAAGTDFPAANPQTTGQVMKLVVVARTGQDSSLDPARLALPAVPPPGPAGTTRRLALDEEMSRAFDGPVAVLLGIVGADGRPIPQRWDAAVTENPAVGATEIWELHNFTEDAHPIHLHLVEFQVVDRRPLQGGRPSAPEPGETGPKDTVIAYPEQITRIKARFDRPGRYVWHCHVLEHEDHEMMRPYVVGPGAR